jgi:N-acetylglucosamine-6-phosphate deacetylase
MRIELAEGRIAAIEPTDVDTSIWVIPGLIDLQINGYGGLDVNAEDVTADVISELTHRLWQLGITAFCPTVITASRARILATLRAIAAARNADALVAQSILGVHVEGPYLSDQDGARGAHDVTQLRNPDLTELAQWQKASEGAIRIVTLAPERRGSTEYIAALRQQGVLASIGHTAASADEIGAAVAAGARMSTHLGNGAQASLPRHPNYIWTQLAHDKLMASFIADGHHLPADTFIAMVRAKSTRRSILVSDSSALAGCPPGNYSTPVGGNVTVAVDGRLLVAGTNYLAGSGRCLLDCIGWAASSTTLTMADAVKMASTNPARILGLPRRGELRVGTQADLTLFTMAEATATLRTEATIVRGNVVYDRSISRGS